jgi:hypothetical protein
MDPNKEGRIMKYVLLLSLTLLTSCAQMMPGLFKTIDDAVTDEAVSVIVDKAAIQRDTNIKVNLEVINTESSPPAK